MLSMVLAVAIHLSGNSTEKDGFGVCPIGTVASVDGFGNLECVSPVLSESPVVIGTSVVSVVPQYVSGGFRGIGGFGGFHGGHGPGRVHPVKP